MPPPASRSAEFIQRRRFTVQDVLHMQKAGIIRSDEEIELVDGEVLLMHAKTDAHQAMASAIAAGLAPVMPEGLRFGAAMPLSLSPLTRVSPDISIYRTGIELADVRGPDVVLAIEVAASSLAFDRGSKARLYAKHGVQELWVLDTERRRAFVHGGPLETGWEQIIELGPRETLFCGAVPGFEIRLADM